MKPFPFKAMLGSICCGLLSFSTLGAVVIASEKGAYGNIGAGVAWIDYPDNLFFADRGESSPFTRNYNLDTDEGIGFGAAIDGKIGTFLPGSIANADSARIELRGFLIEADQSTTRSFADTGAGMRFGWVELNNSTGYGTPNGTTLNTRTEQEPKFWGSDAMLLLDYGIGPNASWSLQLGPSYKRLEQDTNASGNITNAHGNITTTVSMRDQLSTEFRGVKIGAGYDRELNQDWSLGIAGCLSKYWTKSQYDGIYTDSFTNQSASLSNHGNAIGMDLRLEINRKLGRTLKISAYGQLNHLSDVPRVSYGSVPTDSGNGVLSLTSDGMNTVIIGLAVSGSF